MFKQTAQEVHARRIIAQIAKREDISEEEVRCAMQEAIMAGFRRPRHIGNRFLQAGTHPRRRNLLCGQDEKCSQTL